MLTLITGGSKCGKSAAAEKILDGFSGRKFYAATMQPFGTEAIEAIKRHKKIRSGKGFTTIEKYIDIDEIDLPSGCALLIECMGNLCANEMFITEKPFYPADKILFAAEQLMQRTEKLVIVTSQVGEDGIAYDSGTALYIKALSEINRRLAGLADNVIECVYGIAVPVKGGLL